MIIYEQLYSLSGFAPRSHNFKFAQIFRTLKINKTMYFLYNFKYYTNYYCWFVIKIYLI